MATVEPVEGVSIDYAVHGHGRPIALVHGITESKLSWDPLLGPLRTAGYGLVAVDLRGHGASSKAPPYDLMTMAGDVGAVLAAEGIDDALLLGHSLGGAVVSACAAVGVPCRGVVNVDQPLALADFQVTLRALEPALRGSEDDFQAAITAIFDEMAGPLAGPERARVSALRRADQDVVLGIWDLVLTAPVEELDAVVEQVASSIAVPYLSLHGIDPGSGYEDWLTGLLPTATVEVWDGLGHYPHLVEPERFVARIAHFDDR